MGARVELSCPEVFAGEEVSEVLLVAGLRLCGAAPRVECVGPGAADHDPEGMHGGDGDGVGERLWRAGVVGRGLSRGAPLDEREDGGEPQEVIAARARLRGELVAAGDELGLVERVQTPLRVFIGGL